MSDTPQDVRELIADEFARFLREEGARHRPWDFADGLAAIVSPVIRQQERERIAQSIDEEAEFEAGRMFPSSLAIKALRAAAAIARSHSTKPEEETK